MDSEEDEEGSSPLLTLSGTLTSSVNSNSRGSTSTSATLPPPNTRTLLWPGAQASGIMNTTRQLPQASSFTRAEINGEASTFGMSGNVGSSPSDNSVSKFKEGLLQGNYGDESKNHFKYEAVQNSVPSFQGGKPHASKSYPWRDSNELTSYSKLPGNALASQSIMDFSESLATSGAPLRVHSRAANMVDLAAKDSASRDSTNNAKSSEKINAQSRMYFRKRPNDLQNTAPDVLYEADKHLQNTAPDVFYDADKHLHSVYNGRSSMFTGSGDKAYDRATQAQTSLAVCAADSSCDTSTSFQPSFPAAPVDNVRSLNQVSSSANSQDQHFFKAPLKPDCPSTDGASVFLPFRSSKNLQENHELSLSFNHKRGEAGDSKQDFDFSFGSRSFASSEPVTDLTSESRPGQQQFDYHPIQAVAGDLPTQNFFTTGSSSAVDGRLDSESDFCNPSTLNSNHSKKGMQNYLGFGVEDIGEDLRLAEPAQRTSSESQAASSSLEATLTGGLVTGTDDMANFRQPGFGSGDQMGFNSSLPYKKLPAMSEGSNNWMGRSRVYRKMARLLGTTDMSEKHSISKPIQSVSRNMQSSTTVHNDIPDQNLDILSRDFQACQTSSAKSQGNVSRTFLPFDYDFSAKSMGDSDDRQGGLNRGLYQSDPTGFCLDSDAITSSNFTYQDSIVYSAPGNAVTHRETDMATFTASSSMHRNHVLPEVVPMPVDKNMLVPNFTSAPNHKDSVMRSFLMDQPQQQEGLDFAAPQRELVLGEQFVMQDPKDFEMDTSAVSEQQMDLSSFDQEVDSEQPGLSLSDNLALGSHGQQDLNLEAYFNPQPVKDLNLSRKLHVHGLRDIPYWTGSAEGDFSLDEYMNSQIHRDPNSTYLMQSDLPQDMTIYQKPVADRISLNDESTAALKQTGRQHMSSSVRLESQHLEMSELHKELTKTSTKESTKGIRTPRDINRAMEILQGLQESEKAEKHYKQQEWKQQQQLQHPQHQQHLHEQRQQQHQDHVQQMEQHQNQQQVQLPGASLNSSPKKTFQNKHYFESLGLAMTDHQLLEASENLIDEQAVGTFLDQSHLDIADQSSESLQMMNTFQTLPPQPDASEMDTGSGQFAKRDQNHQRFSCSLDYHILKKIALATSLKDSEDQHASMSGMAGQPPANLASILEAGDLVSGSQDFSAHYSGSKEASSHLQRQEDLEEVLKENFSSKDHQRSVGAAVYQNVPSEQIKSKASVGFPFMDVDVQQHPGQQLQQFSDKSQTVTMSTGSDLSEGGFSPAISKVDCESISTSRKGMYNMMKAEQFCDAILSTPRQTVKVHQVVLCSASHYLSSLLIEMSSAPSRSSGSTIAGSDETMFPERKSHLPAQPNYTGHHYHLQHENVEGFNCNSHCQQQYSSSTRLEEQQLASHSSVLLIINCEDIKASSLQTFLVYVYLGTPNLTEANVCDLYLLACSLRVNCLRDRCRDFMQKEQICEDKLKVPELLVSASAHQPQSQGERMREEKETKDQACGTGNDLEAKKVFEDKAINTVVASGGGRHGGSHMEAATQTDRSTHEAGVRGSQEEWVMLKKTKQKTVSPSKPKSSSALTNSAGGVGTAALSASGNAGAHGKLQTLPESLGGPQHQHIHKLFKKGWLSPKRRYKSELHQMDARAGSLSSGSMKDPASVGKDVSKILSGSESEAGHSEKSCDKPPSMPNVVRSNISVTGNDSSEMSQSSSSNTRGPILSSSSLPSHSTQSSTFPVVMSKGPLMLATKTTRTTVEIAAEAAAAKVCAHSYGTRAARGAGKNPVSYATLASGGNRKKSPSSVHTATVSKKKAAIKTDPQSHTGSQEGNDEKMLEEAEKCIDVSNCEKHKLKKCSSSGTSLEQKSETTPNVARQPLKKNIVHRTSHEQLSNEKVNEPSPSSQKRPDNSSEIGHTSSSPDGNMGKNVCDLNDAAGETTHQDFETHKGDCDRGSGEKRSPPQSLMSVTLTSGTVQATTRPLTGAVPVESPPPVLKAASSVPQNFRKRLIHQLNSEKNNNAGISHPSFSESHHQNTSTGVGMAANLPISTASVPCDSADPPSQNSGAATSSQNNRAATSSQNSGAATSSQNNGATASSQKTSLTSSHHSPSAPNLSKPPPETSQSSSLETELSPQVMSGSENTSEAQAPGSLVVETEISACGTNSQQESLSQCISPSLTEKNSASTGKGDDHTCDQTTSKGQNSGVDAVQIEPNPSDCVSVSTDQSLRESQVLLSQHIESGGGSSVAPETGAGRDVCSRDSSDKIQASTTGTDPEEEPFTHKIFKRKRKPKPKKVQLGEPETPAAPKQKKTSSTDTEAPPAKPRHRKSASGSDTEGGGGRAKIRKVATGNSNIGGGNDSRPDTGTGDGDGTLPKVRAPPKKRAKMELALLKAANQARRAVEERRSEPSSSAVSNSQEKGGDVEQEQQIPHKQSKKDPTVEAEKTGVALRKGEKRDQLTQRKKVASKKKSTSSTAVKQSKKKANTIKSHNSGNASKKHIKPSSLEQSHNSGNAPKKLIKPKALPVKKTRKNKSRASDADASVLSSLALQLKAKLREQMLDSGDVENKPTLDDEDEKRRHTAGSEKVGAKCFSCSLCQMRLQSAKRMVKHVRCHDVADEQVVDKVVVVKLTEGFEACDICGYETKDKSYHYMHYHKYFRHGVPLPPGWRCDVCKLCGRVCATPFQFREHMLSHEQLSRFVCWHCGQHFNCRSNFNSHVYHKHSDVRKHQCKVCTKSFKTRTQLKVHLRSHTGERPFRCPNCDYGSTTRGNMKAHLKLHGYTTDRVNELIIEIANKSSELDAKSVDKVMEDIAERVKSGELHAVTEKKQSSESQPSKEMKEKKRRNQSQPRVKKSKLGHGKTSGSGGSSTQPGNSSIQPGNSLHVTVPVLESETAKTPKSVPLGKSKEANTVQGSRIKCLLTEPLSSLTWPTFKLYQPISTSTSSKSVGLQKSQPGQANIASGTASLQHPQAGSQSIAEAATLMTTGSFASNEVTCVPTTGTSGSGDKTSILSKSDSITSASAVTGVPSSDNAGASDALEGNQPVQGFQQLVFPSSSTLMQPTSYAQLVPLATAEGLGQTHPPGGTVQQQPLPIQLFISSDITGAAGVLEVQQQQQQPTLHTLPSSVGNFHAFSGSDGGSNIFASPECGPIIQVMNGAESALIAPAATAVNTEQGQQIVQVLAPDMALTPGNGLGVQAHNAPQIIQLVGTEEGGLSLANLAAPAGMLQPAPQPTFLDSQLFLQDMVSSGLLPVMAPAASIAAPAMQDMAGSGTTLQMSLSVTGEEQFVHHVQAQEPLQVQQQQQQQLVVEEVCGGDETNNLLVNASEVADSTTFKQELGGEAFVRR